MGLELVAPAVEAELVEELVFGAECFGEEDKVYQEINKLVMNLSETYLVIENGNERLGQQKLDLVIL